MKKTILFLLFTKSILAQTSTGKEQIFTYGIRNKLPQTVTMANIDYLTTTGNDGTQGRIYPNTLFEYYLPTFLEFESTNKTLWNNGRINNSSNTMFGQYVFSSNTSGTYSSGFGYAALASNTSGTGNNANGYQSLYSNTTGSYNNAFGAESLKSNTTGIENNAFGYGALTSNTTGGNNTCIGSECLNLNTVGNGNTGVGFNSLYNNVTGNQNTSIGAGSGVSTSNLSNTISIGVNVQCTTSNTVKIGNALITDNYFNGNIHGNSFVKTGGTGSQYLMANGTVTTTAAPSYAVYKALINQVGTDDPTVTILENTIGTIVWSRFGTGSYMGILTNAFPIGKTECICGNSILSATTGMTLIRGGNNIVNVQTYNTSTNATADDVLQFGYERGVTIEIRVYP